MRKVILFSIIGIIAAALSSCATSQFTRGNQYPKMYEEKPLTILVMPPINNTNHVEAKDLLYTSIARPIAEAGYYVISPFLSMEVMKAESAYDAELFIDSKLDKLRHRHRRIHLIEKKKKDKLVFCQQFISHYINPPNVQ